MIDKIPKDCVVVKLKAGINGATIQTFHIIAGQTKTCPLDIYLASTHALDLVDNPHGLDTSGIVATSKPEKAPEAQEQPEPISDTKKTETAEKPPEMDFIKKVKKDASKKKK